MKNDEAINNQFQKPLPYAIGAERFVIGAVSLDNEMMAYVVEVVASTEFYSPECKVVFRAMEELHRKQEIIDPVFILEQVRENGDILHRGAVGLSEIIQSANEPGRIRFTSEEVVKHARLIKKKAVARNLIKVCSNVIAAALAEEEPIEATLDAAETQILATVSDLSKNKGRERIGFYEMHEIVPEMRKQFEGYNKNISNGVSTGMAEIDEMLDGGGLQRKGLYIVGGAEKSGKTSLALDWAYHVSAVEGRRSLIVTAEMYRVTLAKRIFSSHTGIPYSQFRPGFYGDNYVRALEELGIFGQIPISMTDTLRTVSQIERHFRRAVEKGWKENKPVALGVIDYLQLIELDETDNQLQRTRAVEKVSRSFKLLSDELDIPLVAMSSLNRIGLGTGGQGDQQEAVRADAINLRDAGSIAFDCEALFLVHNPAYIPGKKYVPKEITDIELILSRQRNGPTGDIPLKFVGPFMNFMTVSQYQKYLGNTNTDNVIPKTVGQKLREETEWDKLWADMEEK